MKIKTVQIKYILIPFFLIVITDSLIFSQEADSLPVYKPNSYLGINLGIGKTTILNDGVGSLTDLTTMGKNSFSLSFELGRSFSKYLGLSIGLGFSSYVTDVSLGAYSNSFNTTDSENESYERRIAGSDITELQNISFLSLPLSVSFSLPLGKMGAFYLQPVFSLSFPVIKKYQSTGTFTYTGFYPQYNVLLFDLPEYGFVSDAAVEDEGNTDLKSLNLLGGAGAGFRFSITNKIGIQLGVNYMRSLLNTAGYTSPLDFQLSEDDGRINSMMGGSSKVALQSVGLNLSFRYYLK